MVKQYSYAKDKGIILSPHFAVGEFRSFNDATQRLTTDVVLIDDNLILTLEKIFTTLNCSKIIITSGYRDLSFEQYLGGNASGQHVKGTAADFICYDTNGREINPKLVCVTCEDLGLQGVGYMFGGTHIDVRGCKSWFDETQGCKAVNSWREYFGMVNPVVANNAPTSQPTTQRTYTVKAGDSYWAIAQLQLGNGARWTEIKALNGNKEVIHPGDVLKIPK